MIPKPGKKEKRPLGVGAPREKIVQKGIQIILEAIYEPKFLDCSHGFRPGRSTHSALKLLHLKAHHHSWVIQGDISKCFDKIPHQVIIDLLKKDIKCDKLLAVILKSLKGGYQDPDTKGRIVKTEIGTPQGSVVSPLLANIVLHELDKYVMEEIVATNTVGRRRRTNPVYNKIAVIRDPRKKYSYEATPQERKDALDLMRRVPRMDPYDPNYRRAMYVRYADDFVVLFEGPKAEAEIIKQKIGSFLAHNTGLELNDAKTVITNVKEGFKFLGATIVKPQETGSRSKHRSLSGAHITMRANVRARVNAPMKKLIEDLIKVGFAGRDSRQAVVAKPMTSMVNQDHATLLQFYNSKINGILNYYSFAANRSKL
jgi:group II intron reverse transcriptase/maturase